MFKNLKLWLGCLLLIIGTALIVYAGTQSKININSMTASDWKETNIAGIGTATEGKILAAVPVSNMSSIYAISGIGDVKATAISYHFCTYDTCRFEIFIAALVAGIIMEVIFGLLIIFIITRKKIFKDEIKESISVIARK